MIIHEVKLNGKLIANAGRNDLCVLTTTVLSLGILGDNSGGTNSERAGNHSRVSISGVSSGNDQEKNAHYNWESLREIVLGDEISIKILESDNPDSPKIQTPRTPKEIEEEIYIGWKQARDLYIKYKDKYE